MLGLLDSIIVRALLIPFVTAFSEKTLDQGAIQLESIWGLEIPVLTVGISPLIYQKLVLTVKILLVLVTYAVTSRLVSQSVFSILENIIIVLY